MLKPGTRIVFATFALVLCLSALAAEDAAPGYSDETLTGDWGGLRGDWFRRGLTVDLGYKSDALRVAGGGLRQGGRPLGQAAPWPGSSVRFGACRPEKSNDIVTQLAPVQQRRAERKPTHCRHCSS